VKKGSKRSSIFVPSFSSSPVTWLHSNLPYLVYRSRSKLNISIGFMQSLAVDSANFYAAVNSVIQWS